MASEAARRRQEMAEEGQRHLEETIAASFQILVSMNDELCNAGLWSSSSVSATAAAGYQHHHSATLPTPHSVDSDAADAGGAPSPGGSLDEARHRYKSAVAALRASISAVSSCAQEIESKNKQVKLLIDQLRDLIADIAMWQSPCSV
ncbi:hypothetical protein Zm00014a_032547 [Zea mays]|uniref:Mediator of RNA polymerase II transcription subunit 30 n=1 Tax=Zea mays TaxID=4577 RepID=A0A3L6G6U5_MAIZE|nr:hypothetical protein Zm00014a_032547 [Zea mays]